MKQLFNSQIGDWIPKHEAMEFLGYKRTQMNEFIRRHSNLRVSKIGRRTFISVSSLIKVLELNEQ